MTVEYLIGLFLLGTSLAWTPGPNNTLLTASGAKFGFKSTIPHILGVFIGFGFMQFVIWTGLGQVFLSLPLLRELLRYIGAAILLWLTWKIATSKRPTGEVDATDKPWTFLQAAAFQWVNPKAWVMSVSIVAQLPKTDVFWVSPLISAIVFASTGLFSSAGWALFGRVIQRFLNSDRRFRTFCLFMAGLLLLTVVGIVFMDI